MTLQDKIRLTAYALSIQLLLAVPGFYLEYLAVKQPLTGSALHFYLFLIILSGVLYCLGIYGFVLIAKKYRNFLLLHSTYGFIAIGVLTIFATSLIAGMTRSSENTTYMVISLTMGFLTGVPGIPFAIGLFQLKPKLGGIAEAAGVLAVVISASLLTVLLGIIGLVLLFPFTILLTLILFRESRK